MSLAEQLRNLERRFGRPVVRAGTHGMYDERDRMATEWSNIDAILGGGLFKGALHEWFGVSEARREDATAGEHDVGTLKSLRSPWSGAWTPPLLPIVHLVRQAMSNESFSLYAVWIGRRCFPCGGVLIDAAGNRRLLERSLFVLARSSSDRLWASDLALRCPAVSVVIADGSGFDMAATRRLQLAAKAHHKPVMVVRPPWETRQLSAAQTHWSVRWVSATTPRDHEGTTGWKDESDVANPRWRVELLRCKGRQVGLGTQPECHPREWVLEWDRGQGAVRLLTPMARATGETHASTNDRRLQLA